MTTCLKKQTNNKKESFDWLISWWNWSPGTEGSLTYSVLFIWQGGCGDVVSQTEQATQSQDNPEEIVPEPVAEANPEKLASDIDIVPNDEVAQRNDNAVPSSEQPAVEAPITVFQPIEPILSNHPHGMIYPIFEGAENIRTNTISAYVYVPPNLGEFVKTHK